MSLTYFVPAQVVASTRPQAETLGVIQATRAPGLPVDSGTPFGVALVVDREQIRTRDQMESALALLREALRTDVELAR